MREDPLGGCKGIVNGCVIEALFGLIVTIIIIAIIVAPALVK
jgi:hypothetical protein